MCQGVKTQFLNEKSGSLKGKLWKLSQKHNTLMCLWDPMPFFPTISFGAAQNSCWVCFPECITVKEVYVFSSEHTLGRIQLSCKCMESPPPHAAIAEESTNQVFSWHLKSAARKTWCQISPDHVWYSGTFITYCFNSISTHFNFCLSLPLLSRQTLYSYHRYCRYFSLCHLGVLLRCFVH